MKALQKTGKPKGRATLVGVNRVDSDHYGGFSVPLRAAESDALALSRLATDAGIRATTLLGADATRAAVLGGIRDAAQELVAGDLFLLSFSGYGGQLPDHRGVSDSGVNETWCLSDAQVLEREVLAEFLVFPVGVRVQMIVDCNSSGTVTRGVAPYAPPGGNRDQQAFRMLPAAIGFRTYTSNRAFYDVAEKDCPIGFENDLTSVLVFQAAQDNQTAAEEESGGIFTRELLAVWADGAFKGDSKSFIRAIQRRMPFTQQPRDRSWGNAKAMLAQRPFTL